MKATKITVAELAANLDDVLTRVKDKRERFHVVENSVVLAEIAPTPPGVYTVADFRREFGEQFVPKGMADAIQEGRQVLRMGVEPPWWPAD